MNAQTKQSLIDVEQLGFQAEQGAVEALPEGARLFVDQYSGAFKVKFAEERPQWRCKDPEYMGRWTVIWAMKRALKQGERVLQKKKTKDFRLANLLLRSAEASAAEKYHINGPPVPGYSHCLCGCGEALDLAKQKEHPHAFAMGHSPADKQRADTLAAAVDEDLPVVRQPNKPAPTGADPLEAYRPLFERVICMLPWSEFRKIIDQFLVKPNG